MAGVACLVDAMVGGDELRTRAVKGEARKEERRMVRRP